ncbi:unnamed protein product [Brassicogethes aeneus]|uniref:N-acetylglucosamine-6-phosphate deacetylase n=1 Tax=Brassicogethes aeneus TaxID=1431903 RepID=A0A9P0BBD0_BRAAE|nr:unnamed protein product [Brassicogethes aeneus]
MSGQLIQFVNCKILRDHKFILDDFWVRDGKIVDPEKVFFDEKIKADKQVDCHGNLIVPGFIDLQINGGFGYDFSTGDTKKALDVVSKGILAHGVTSFCPTVVTSPIEVYHKILPLIRKKKGGKHGAAILGCHCEGPFINVAKNGAHPPECILEYTDGFKSIEETYGDIENINICTLAPEFNNSEEVIKELKKKNIVVSLGHSKANLKDGEEAVKNGATLITHLFNAMLPFHHRDPGLVGLLASDKCDTIYFGIIADNIHTHPAAQRIAYRVCPKGLILVTDAISALGLNEGSHSIGQLKIEIRNKMAFIAGTNTLCGSMACLLECVRLFVEATGCTREYAFEAASLHPAKVLGIENQKGTLNFDSEADFVILDSDLNLVSTWIAGECVYEN